MVQLISSDGIVKLESTKAISEGELALIKNNKKKVCEICKDLGICHHYYKTEDGNIMSQVGCTATSGCDAIKATDDIEEKHRILLETVNKMEQPQTKAPEGDNQREFFTIRETENGYECAGNMEPKKVFNMLKTAVIFKIFGDEQEPE